MTLRRKVHFLNLRYLPNTKGAEFLTSSQDIGKIKEKRRKVMEKKKRK